MSGFQDLTGQKFGELTVQKQATYRIQPSGKKVLRWYCECSCGGSAIVCTSSLKNGKTSSCGCKKKRPSIKTHGKSKTRLYRIWCSMKTRCSNPARRFYKDYGGRGIDVCVEWKEKFENFYEWAINNGYSDTLSIDRKDVDGNYEPDNCRWATTIQQGRNKRNTKLYEYNGESLCLSEWADKYGIEKKVISDRLRAGWKFEDALKLTKEQVKDNQCQYIFFHGEKVKVLDLAKQYDISVATIRNRINKGYKEDDLISKNRLNNTSGHVGVMKKHGKKWDAYIHIKKKRINLGTFDTYEEAVEAREKAEFELKRKI